MELGRRFEGDKLRGRKMEMRGRKMELKGSSLELGRSSKLQGGCLEQRRK